MAITGSPDAPKLPFGGSVNTISFYIAGGAPKRMHWRLAQLAFVGMVSCGAVAAASLLLCGWSWSRSKVSQQGLHAA